MQSGYRVPKISITNNNGSIRLKFELNKQVYRLTIPGGYGNKQAMALAETVRDKIKEDILLGIFDGDMSKYDPKVKIAQNIARLKEYSYSLADAWEYYKTECIRKNRGEETTRKHIWRQVTLIFSKIDPIFLSPDRSVEFVRECKKHYAFSTLDRSFQALTAASAMAYKDRKIPANPWSEIRRVLKDESEKEVQRLKENKRSGKAFTQAEVSIIIDAFRSNRFNSPYSPHKHSYYANLVEFLYLTGCRPEEVFALTWGDVKDKYLIISKAFSCGVLKNTKTKEVRIYPLSEQVKTLLKKHLDPSLRDSSKLIFPSREGRYINLRNFTKRIWSPIVKELVKTGEVQEYLPTYHLRHSNITAMNQAGSVDLATLAALTGTSVRMMNQTYLAVNNDIVTGKVELPEI